MNAVSSDLAHQAEQLSADVVRPIPGSRRIHVTGARADVRVAMREIVLERTPTLFGGEDNPPLAVYDTSGPYTDPEASIDLTRGLPRLREGWIAARGDTVELPGPSSDFGRRREADPKLDAIRAEVEESRGAADAAYINRLIKVQRGLAAAGRGLVATRVRTCGKHAQAQGQQQSSGLDEGHELFLPNLFLGAWLH